MPAVAHDVTPSVSEEPGGVGGAPPLPPGPSLTLGMTGVAGGEEPPTVIEVAAIEMPAPAVAHDVTPSVSEEPGGTGGAPPLPPGPSLTLGMTEVARGEEPVTVIEVADVEIPAPAVAHDVTPSVSEEPGGTGGAPPLPPGPSLTLGLP